VSVPDPSFPAPPPKPHETSAEGSSRAQIIAQALLAIGLTLLGLWTLRGFLPALVWAGILAIAVWPLYQRACRRWPPGRHNILLPACFTLAIALVFIVPLVLAAVQAAREAHGVLAYLDTARSNGIPPPDWLGHLPIGSQEATSWWNDNLASPEAATNLLRRARHADVVSNGRSLGMAIVHRVVLFAFTLLTLFFLYRDGEWLAKQTIQAAERVIGPSGERLGMQMVRSIRGTLDGLVLVGLGEGAVLGVGYAIAGAPHAALLGALTAVAAMIPFGAPLLFLSVSALLAAQGSIVAAISIAALGFVVLFIADHFLRPIMIGGATKLPFLWVLLGILGGVETFGLLGLFLGPAIMAALVLLWQEVMPPREDTPSQAGSYRA
jgi:predicted PurR-regulated permease PerM